MKGKSLVSGCIIGQLVSVSTKGESLDYGCIIGQLVSLSIKGESLVYGCIIDQLVSVSIKGESLVSGCIIGQLVSVSTLQGVISLWVYHRPVSICEYFTGSGLCVVLSCNGLNREWSLCCVIIQWSL